MNEAESDCTLKIVLVGGYNVGKTALLVRYIQREYSHNFMASVDMYKTIEINGKKRDTPGQSRFRSIIGSNLRDTNGVILVYDVTDRESFDYAKSFLVDVDKYTSENIPRLLVGNKCDLTAKRVVTYEEAKEYADSIGIEIIETSAKDATNVDKVFSTMATQILSKLERTESEKIESEKRNKNVLIGVTGSVAAVKICELATKINSFANVKIIFTKSAEHFYNISNEYNKEYFKEFKKQNIEIYLDEDEWKNYKRVKEDKVLHIELRNWSDLLLIAPLSCDTLAKLSNGLCDNLLTCVARAWNFSKPIYVAPAMNTGMWSHPITDTQLNILKSWGYKIIFPKKQVLACGEYGIGAMESVDIICNKIKEELKNIE